MVPAHLEELIRAAGMVRAHADEIETVTGRPGVCLCAPCRVCLELLRARGATMANGVPLPDARAFLGKGHSMTGHPRRPAPPEQIEIGQELEHLAQVDEVKRTSSQREQVLLRLRRGRASGAELERVGGRRFSARIHELRQAGHTIVLVERSRATGATVYELLQDLRPEVGP